MEDMNLESIKSQLVERRLRLRSSVGEISDPENLYSLIREVDSALERIDNGTYGLCEVCHDPIEEDRLLVDPLMKVCLDHLSYDQQRALESDIESAVKIQRGLLPQNNITVQGLDFSYSFNPAGPVSGDFVDLIPVNNSSVIFVLGDVSGKGIAASLIMSHLHALIRSLLLFDLPVNEIVQKVNRLFCESTISPNYATLVFGKADPNGDTEICVAGHNPPLLLQKEKVTSLKATGVPVGLFCESKYEVHKFKFNPGDYILLYSDGLTESSFNEVQYGEDRVKSWLLKAGDQSPKLMIDLLMNDHKSFLKEKQPSDDVTVAAIRKVQSKIE
jgi:phosphoserine phosphatase RsbU/P